MLFVWLFLFEQAKNRFDSFACKLPLINKCELSIQAMSGNKLSNRWTVDQITTLWDTCGLKLANCDKTTCFIGICLTWTTNT